MQIFWLEQSLADVRRAPDWLSGQELERIAGMRVPKRAQDWQLGRWTGKHGVAAYLALSPHPRTLSSIEIRPAASGAPEAFVNNWRAPVSISLSHREGRAACALGPYGISIGCDLEFVEPRSDAFIADYFTAEEQQVVASTTDPERFRLVALLWSAKESVLKAMTSGLRLDPRSVAINFGANVDMPTTPIATDEHPLKSATWRPFRALYAGADQFHGWWQSDERFVRTLVTVPASAAPSFSELFQTPAV